MEQDKSRSSVIDVEERFQQLLYILATQSSWRLNLTNLETFLTWLSEHKTAGQRRPYIQELYPYLLENLTPNSLEFRTPDFLQRLDRILAIVQKAVGNQGSGSEFNGLKKCVSQTRAGLFFALGEWEQGLEILTSAPDDALKQELFRELSSEKELLPLERLERVLHTLRSVKPDKIGDGVMTFLEGLHRDLQEREGTPRSDQVWVLLVEQDSLSGQTLFANNTVTGTTHVGTIQPLGVKIMERPSDAEEDLILFDNRPMSYDDRMFQQAQDAVTSAKAWSPRSAVTGSSHYKVVYSFPEKRSFYTGDSLGLAMGLLNGAAISHLSAQKYRYRIHQDLALTGALDVTGAVRPIAEPALETKLKTVFFSSFRKILLPEKNLDQARKILEPLNSEYPHRQLEIQTSSMLKDNFRNSVVILREKTRLSERVLFHRRKTSWNFAAAILVLGFITGGFYLLNRDMNPVKIKIDGKYLVATNVDNKELWRHNFNFILTEASYSGKTAKVIVNDLDGDGENEVVLATSELENKDMSGIIFYFESNGELVWSFHDHKTLMFGDELMDDLYRSVMVRQHDFDGDGRFELVCVFSHYLWYPDRIILMNLEGKLLGEYWNSGGISDIAFIDLDGDELDEIIFSGTNNDYNRAVLGVLDYRSISGHSPQEQYAYTPQGIPPGSQRWYIRFPDTQFFKTKTKGDREIVYRITELGSGMLSLVVLREKIGGTMHFQMGYDFRVNHFDFSDSFYGVYKKDTGTEFHDDYTPEEIKKHFRILEFWDGDRWVTEPAENKYWHSERFGTDPG